jgi:hypothetical protein
MPKRSDLHSLSSKKWFLCQIDKDEVLKYPQNPTESLKSGHKTLSNNIPVFFQINEMPIPIDVRLS